MEIALSILVLTVYVVAGLIVVPVAMLILVTVFERPRGNAFAIASAGWYLGAPIVLFAYANFDKWQVERENSRVRGEYLALCRESAIESISKVSENAEWLKLDTDERDIRDADTPLYDAFGTSFKQRLFRMPSETKPNWGKYNNVDSSANPIKQFLIVKVRSTDHIPYVGTFFAKGIDIEIVDPTTRATLARRRTFTSGKADQASSRDCDNKNLHDTNLDFVQRAVISSKGS